MLPANSSDGSREGRPPGRSRASARSGSGRRERSRDAGSGTVWLIMIMALVWLAAGLVITTGGLRALRHRAHMAAEQSALAAASATRAGRGEAAACARAARLANANAGGLVSCKVRNRVADVSVRLTGRSPLALWAGSVTARARAGPARPMTGTV